MKHLQFSAILTVLLLDCQPKMSRIGDQGILGQVMWKEGNHMPVIGEEAVADRISKPIQRTILIYEPTSMDDVERSRFSSALITRIDSKLVAKVKSKKDGAFRVDLPPGKYSILTQEDGGLFANRFDGNNIINPVQVDSSKWEVIQVVVDYKAYY